MHKKLYVFSAAALIISLFIFATTRKFDDFSNNSVTSNHPENVVAIDNEGDVPVKNNASLYDSLQLEQLGLSRRAFDIAVRGRQFLLSAGRLNSDNLLSIVDFSLPSSKKRLFVLDLENKKLVFNSYVAHGRNSGKEMAHNFSNEPESNKSSLGFYVTGDTYIGKHGYSLRLFGEEKGINDNANSRAIVMHSAAYVSEGAIKMQGFIGRSLGCPALPENLYKPIIDKIKNGTCLYLYSPDKYYTMHSNILRKIA
jgi:hypothetical protein